MSTGNFEFAGNGPIAIGASNDAGGKPEFVNPGEFRWSPDDGGNGTATGSGGNDAPKRRGRPVGSRNQSSGATKSAKAAHSLEGIEKTLLSMHGIAAAVFKQPLLNIDASEAKVLADAVAEVSKHYGDLVPDPKMQAWLNLAMILATVYGPRGYLMYVGVRPQPQAPMTPPPMGDGGSNVFNMTGFASET